MAVGFARRLLLARIHTRLELTAGALSHGASRGAVTPPVSGLALQPRRVPFHRCHQVHRRLDTPFRLGRAHIGGRCVLRRVAGTASRTVSGRRLVIPGNSASVAYDPQGQCPRRGTVSIVPGGREPSGGDGELVGHSHRNSAVRGLRRKRAAVRAADDAIRAPTARFDTRHHVVVAANEWKRSDHVDHYLALVDTVPHRAEGESVLLQEVPLAARRILDLGTGDGRLLARVRADRPASAAVAVDVSEPMLERARERFADQPVDLVHHDLAEPLPTSVDSTASYPRSRSTTSRTSGSDRSMRRSSPGSSQAASSPTSSTSHRPPRVFTGASTKRSASRSNGKTPRTASSTSRPSCAGSAKSVSRTSTATGSGSSWLCLSGSSPSDEMNSADIGTAAYE